MGKTSLHNINGKSFFKAGIFVVLIIGLFVSVIAANQSLVWKRSKAAQAPPSLAVEVIHYGANGGVRNVNGFYQSSKTHYAPSVFHNFQSGGHTYYHSLTILDTSGQANSATVKYYNSTGSVVAEKSYSLAAKGFVSMGWEAGLPDGFSGSVVVTSTKNTVVEMAIANTYGHLRGYRAIPAESVSSTLYAPIAYDRVFTNQGTFVSNLIIQNTGAATIPANAIEVKIYCKDGGNPVILKNNNSVPAKAAAFINILVADGYCSQSDIYSNLFGHAIVTSTGGYQLAGVEVVANQTSWSQRSEELSPRLSKTWYVPSIMVGTWPYSVNSSGSSLNISNPNQASSNTNVLVYKKSGDTFTFLETRKPQGPKATNSCASQSTPIPLLGERSFFYRKNTATETCFENWGSGENAFGFNIINSDQPVVVSYNKTSKSDGGMTDDYAELALSSEEILPTVYVPQLFVNFLGSYTTRINVLNPSDTGANYDFEFYDNTGVLKLSSTYYIGAKQVLSPSLTGLESNKAYSLKIKPR